MKKTISLSLIFLLIANIASAKGVGLKQVSALVTSTYIFAIMFMGAAILLAAVISNLIKYEGGTNPRDPGKRRIWFWIFAILAPVAFFLYNLLSVIPTIKKGPALDKFGVTHIIGTAIILVGYIVIGFVLSKMMKRGKLGNWFPSKEK
tara:strand:+ start:10448 stop:10891 length:444 start_codon:yes stop_codon:yes gene_type:complete